MRLIHLATIRGSPYFSILYIDLRMYDEWGMRIAAGQLLSERPFFLDPLYPYFLGAIYAIFGHRYEAVMAVQALLGSLVPPLLLYAARDAFGRPVARLAGIIAAVYLPAIYFGGILMKPGLTLVLVTLTLWLLSRALGGAPLSIWLAAGVSLALAALTRGNLVLVAPLLTLWLLLRHGAAADPPLMRRALDRTRQLQAGAFVLGCGLIFALPATHNWVVGKELILTTANAGANFYIGNNPSNDSGEYQQLPFVHANPMYEQRDFKAEAERRTGETMNDRQISRFWFGESLDWVRDEPLAWAGLLWRKVRSFWGAYEIPDSLDYYLYRKTAPLLRLPVPGFGLLAPLGLLGMALAVRRTGWPRLLILFTLVYAGTVILFFVFSRFRMVVAPALYVFAAFAVLELVRRWRDRGHRRAAVWPSVLLVALVVFCNFPVRAREDSRAYRLAAAIGLPTRLESSSQGRFNLGVAYAALANDAEDPERLLRLAEAELSLALEHDQETAKPHIELGKVLARQRKNREAIEVYRQAAEIEPFDYKIHHALGLLHDRLGEAEAAEASYRQSLRIVPAFVPSATRLGRLLLQAGRNDEAEEVFRHALRYAPDSPEALAGLSAARSMPSPSPSTP